MMQKTREAESTLRLSLANHQVSLRSSPFPMIDMISAIQQIEEIVDQQVLPTSSSLSSSSSSSLSLSETSNRLAVTVDSNMFDDRPFILAEDVIAPVNVPFTNCSRLDGYAVISDDGVGHFNIVVSRRAGDGTTMNPLNRGEVAYVTTGAPIPIGATAICKIEDTGLVYDTQGNFISSSVHIKVATKPWEGVRKAGSDVREGEVLLPAGHVLMPVDIGSLLLAKVQTVFRKRSTATLLPSFSDSSNSSILSLDDGCIGILSTGDEIVDITTLHDRQIDIVEEEELLQKDTISESTINTMTNNNKDNNTMHQKRMNDDFVWDSNKPMLSAMVKSHGFTPIDCGIARDKGGVDAMCEAILSAASTCKLLIITGGVSMGDKDHVKPALVKLGAEILFGRLMMKPGKPCTAAILPRIGKLPLLIFALPGNPVSAAVCFNVLVVPVLRRFSGLPWQQCRLTKVKVCLVGESIQLDPERPEYHRATVWWASEEDDLKSLPSGVSLCGRSTGAQASSRMQSVSNANALLCLPASSEVIKPRSIVDALLIGAVYNRQAIPISISTPLSNSNVIFSSSCGGHHPSQSHHIHTQVSSSSSTHQHIDHNHQHQPSRQEHLIETINDTPKRPVSISVITISDSSYNNGAIDKSGPEIISTLIKTYPQWDIQWIRPSRPRKIAWENNHLPTLNSQKQSQSTTISTEKEFSAYVTLVPDEYDAIKEVLLQCVELDSHLILTTGGTGFGPRDITPEATESILIRHAPGIVHAMLAASLKHTPMAALSRYAAGTREKSLIINLPGSPKAVKECLEAIEKVLPHAIGLIRS
jgi:gephyrin